MKKILLAILIGSFLCAQGVIQEKNSCLSFDGVNDYVNCGNNASLDILNTVTVEMWFLKIKDGSNPINSADYPLKGNCEVWIYTNNRVLFAIGGTENYGNWIRTDVNAISNGKRYHFVGVYDKNGGENNMKIYLNATIKAQETKTNQIRTGITTYLGINYSAAGGYLNGLIDEVRIYSRALSADEIYYNYTHRQPYSKDSLKLWLKMDEGTGTVAYDSSGYNNNGTLYNGVSWGWESPFIAARQ